MSSSAGSTMAPGDGSEAPAATKTTVVIGNLKRDVDKEALKALLCQLGRVTNFRLQQPPGVDPASPATGIVDYASAEDAGRVVAHVHGKLILGRPVTAWVPVPGGSPPPLPQGPPAPNTVPSSAPTPGGPARAAYPGDMNNGARYPKPAGQASGHEDPRWERPPPPQQGQRGPPPPGAYGDGYSHNQRQQHQQQPWHPGGRPTPQQQGGPGGAAAGTGGASRFRGEGDPAAHYAERQWQDQGHDEEDESGAWERPERHHYPPPGHRAPPMRREHPAAYRRPPPPGPTHGSGWYEEADSRGGVPAHAGYGDGGGQLRGPPGRGMMPRDASGGSAAVPPRGSDDGYGDEGVPAGKRRRPPPPGGAARGGMLPPGRAAAAAAWTEDGEYTVPPPAISIKGEDFEKEVVKAAALLVAEREMRAREEARKQGKKGDWADGEAPPGDEDDGHTESKRKSGSKARSGGGGGGGGRSAGEDGKPQRKKRESSSSRGGGGGGEYQDDKGDDVRPKKKRNRRDDGDGGGGGGGGSSPHGNGRTESRGDDRDRHSSNGKRSAEEGPSSSKGKPAKAREEESRGRHREDSRGRHKDQDSRSRDKEGRSSRSRPSAKPGSSSGWDRDRGGGGDGSPRGGGGGGLPYEHSTADTGYYVHVGGVSFSTTFTTLAKRFAAFGDVNGFKVIFNKVSCSAAETSKRRGSKDEPAKAAVVTASSGFAFISFDNKRGMEKAVECMDGQELDGHILKVTRGKTAPRPTAGVDSYRSQAGQPSSAQRAPHRRPEPRGNQEHHQQHHQARKIHKPQPRPERGGDRRQAPISSTGSAAASSLIRDAQSSRGGGGGGRGGGVGGGGRNGGEKTRDPSPDPLGALRSPRPATASRKEAPAVKLETNGRLKTGYGGKPSGRDNGSGGGDVASPPRRIVQYKTSEDTRASTNTLSSSVRRVEQRLSARPADAPGSDFYTSRFKRP